MLDVLNFRVILQYRVLFLQGLWATTWISAIAILGASIAGVLACTARFSRMKAFSYAALVYIEVIRSTPLLAQIYFCYYGFPSLGIHCSEIQTGLFVLSLHHGAYIAEILRSGIKTVSYGQIEAASASGLTLFQRLRHVIFPQAVSYTVSPFLGQAIVLVKSSALLSLISIFELTRAGQMLASERFMPTEGFFTVAVLYLMLYYLLKFFSRYSQKRLSLARRGQ